MRDVPSLRTDLSRPPEMRDVPSLRTDLSRDSDDACITVALVELGLNSVTATTNPPLIRGET